MCASGFSHVFVEMLLTYAVPVFQINRISSVDTVGKHGERASKRRMNKVAHAFVAVVLYVCVCSFAC